MIESSVVRPLGYMSNSCSHFASTSPVGSPLCAGKTHGETNHAVYMKAELTCTRNRKISVKLMWRRHSPRMHWLHGCKLATIPQEICTTLVVALR